MGWGQSLGRALPAAAGASSAGPSSSRPAALHAALCLAPEEVPGCLPQPAGLCSPPNRRPCFLPLGRTAPAAVALNAPALPWGPTHRT